MGRRCETSVVHGTGTAVVLATLVVTGVGGCGERPAPKKAGGGGVEVTDRPGSETNAAAAGQPASGSAGARPKAGQPASGSARLSSPKSTGAQPKAGQPAASAGTSPKPAASDEKLVPLSLSLPKPAFIGTPQNVPAGANVEMKPKGWVRPPFMAPAGVKNVAFEKPVSASDEEPIIGELDLVTDGDKEAMDGSYVELGFDAQHVQIDLEEVCEVYAVLFWHYHGSPDVYHDVVVQVADDPDFITGVRTIFNNDHDNSAGLGIGKDYEYFETRDGKLLDAGGVRTRYVRLYSNGNTKDDMNRYTEVEVYGRPVE